MASISPSTSLAELLQKLLGPRELIRVVAAYTNFDNDIIRGLPTPSAPPNSFYPLVARFLLEKNVEKGEFLSLLKKVRFNDQAGALIDAFQKSGARLQHRLDRPPPEFPLPFDDNVSESAVVRVEPSTHEADGPEVESPLCVDDMVRTRVRFSEAGYRSAAFSCPTRTHDGIRTWHPEATSLLLLEGRTDERPRILYMASTSSVGIGCDLTYAPISDSHVLCLFSKSDFDIERCLAFFASILLPDRLIPDVQSLSTACVHLSHLFIDAPPAFSSIKVSQEPLPPVTPQVRALLLKASEEGQLGRPDASMLYRQAIDVAVASNDDTGFMKATCGYALCLLDLGYTEDSEHILSFLVRQFTFDSHYGGWVCRTLASLARSRRELDVADKYLAQAAEIERSNPMWTDLGMVANAMEREDFDTIFAKCTALDSLCLPEVNQKAIMLAKAYALANTNRPTEASAILSAIQSDEVVELDLIRSRVECCLLPKTWRLSDREFFKGKVASILARRDESTLLPAEVTHLQTLARKCHQAGMNELAESLIRLRFLNTEIALDRKKTLIAICAGADSTLILSPAVDGQVKEINKGRVWFDRLLHQANIELQRGTPSPALEYLANILFPNGNVPHGEVIFGADGLIAPAPIQSAAVCASGETQPSIFVREALPFRGSLGSPKRREIASMADAEGDLPFASMEVEQNEAEFWYRRDRVTFANLAALPAVGLLHIAVHTRRNQGIPELVLRDGNFTPLEISRLHLQGHPVVVLSSCSTGENTGPQFVGRSFADAFIRAGASSVILTRWPISDREMMLFTRGIIQEWPFVHVARTVQVVSSRLRLEGHSARLWASPMVF